MASLFLYSVIINIQNALHARALRLKDIAIKGEAMANIIFLPKIIAESVHWVHRVIIILLQDFTDGYN